MNKNIIIADDHSMIRKGLKLILRSLLLNNIEEAATCADLMRLLQKKECTHLLLDVIFPDGTALEIIPNIKQLYPDLKIMICSMQSPTVYAQAFKQYGVNYYLPKSMTEEETIFYLNRFMNDDNMLPIKSNMFSVNNPFSVLSPRELEVLHYVLGGHSTKSIADHMNLTMSTISTLKKRIFDKTYTDNLAQLLELATLHNINH